MSISSQGVVKREPGKNGAVAFIARSGTANAHPGRGIRRKNSNEEDVMDAMLRIEISSPKRLFYL